MLAMPGRRPIFAAVAATIRDGLATGRWPTGLPAERPLAEMLGVGRPTVRKALALLRGNATLPVGTGGHLLWVGSDSDDSIQALILHLVEAAQGQGRAVQAMRLAEPATTIPSQLGTALAGAGGVIVHNSWTTAVLAGADPGQPVVPVVFQTMNRPWPALHHVACDRLRAAQLATLRLVAKGRRRIGLITGGTATGPWGTPWRDEEAHLGWAAGLAEAGLAAGPVLVPGEESIASGQIAAWLAATKPDGLVLDMDWRSVAVDAAAAVSGQRIPDDLAVIGLGDTAWARTRRPGLTSVAFGLPSLAQQAVRCAGLPRPSSAEIWRAQPVLVVRSSDG
jgi:DNA-binding transcriptional regulator YhcF (GntR family)